ncbi:MAG: cryptochrome/photolyase family protein [Verrucomicrobia bacterium]|nr:cryptochrome/photolyase family protein [Verrucomicrobiota bacterium]
MTTVWILGDQLTLENAALAGCDPGNTRVLLIESRARAVHRRHHRRKLVLVYAAMRHFAADLQEAGWTVDYQRLDQTPVFGDALRRHVRAFRTERLRILEPSDFATRHALPQWARDVGVVLDVVPNNLFLVGRDEFRDWAGASRRLRMEHHYRRVRSRLGVLMESDGSPAGGTWNLDSENRRTVSEWRRDGCPRPPAAPPMTPDPVTREVIEMVDREFPDHPGRAEGFDLPVDRAASLRWLDHFLDHRLPKFGPYEDLMLSEDPVLFHSRLTPMLNLGLLRPLECVQAAERRYREGRAPLASVEGFVRQIVGWREFIHGVYWLRGPDYLASNALDARRPLPRWFWTGDTPMNCLAQCLRQVLDTGYNHHIQRLMVLGNFLLLAGVRPDEALDWFNELYVDAHDWVMAANVVGMALHADGGFMATKPYAAGGAYIARMSDYCRGCRFRPTERSGPGACPFTLLYWDFIARHAARFASNPRMAAIVRSWTHRSESDRRSVLDGAARVLETLL